MMIEDLIHITCSRKNGASKKEIFLAAKAFNLEIEPSTWRRFLYVVSKGRCPDLYCENKRWHCYESEYYKSIVEFVANNKKGVRYMGMAMGVISTWINENHDTFKTIFNPVDY